MNKLVVALVACTAVSASAAIYWHQQLMEERARNAGLSGPEARTAPEGPAPRVAARTAAPAASAFAEQPPPGNAAEPQTEAPPAAAPYSAPPATAAAYDSGPRYSEKDRAQIRRSSADYLRKYQDPAGRAELRRQSLERQRLILEGFARERHLDAQTFEKLLEMLAGQELEIRAAQSRCVVDPQCETPPGFMEMRMAQRQAVDELLGAGGDAAIRDWRSTQLARRMLKGFEARLPPTARLSGTQSNVLVAALKAERDAAVQEFAAANQPLTGFSNVDGMTVTYQLLPTMEERLASAQSYVQRMKDRAATVLNGQQLLVYYQMQDELLFDLQRQLLKQQQREREGGS